MATTLPTAISQLVPLEVYLHTSYRPDCDWIDGEVKERNWGDQPHASVQASLISLLHRHAPACQIRVLPEQRVQVKATRFRIPDICVVRRETPFEAIVRTAPLLCVEILSREDRMSEIQERIEDYFAMGVPSVWVVDPNRRRAYAALPTGAFEPVPTELTVANRPIRVPVADIFAELDDMQATSNL